MAHNWGTVGEMDNWISLQSEVPALAHFPNPYKTTQKGKHVDEKRLYLGCPVVRQVVLRDGCDEETAHKNFRQDDLALAALMKFRIGVEAAQPCDACRTGKGPFPMCILPPPEIMDSLRWTHSSCSNCDYSWKGHKCNLRKQKPGSVQPSPAAPVDPRPPSPAAPVDPRPPSPAAQVDPRPSSPAAVTQVRRSARLRHASSLHPYGPENRGLSRQRGLGRPSSPASSPSPSPPPWTPPPPPTRIISPVEYLDVWEEEDRRLLLTDENETIIRDSIYEGTYSLFLGKDQPRKFVAEEGDYYCWNNNGLVEADFGGGNTLDIDRSSHFLIGRGDQVTLTCKSIATIVNVSRGNPARANGFNPSREPEVAER
ncbi:hypothetical protein F5B20DRAFT_591243 [Whalleya microplaca]|nr:hypothetical protein F5B20DRAFT_591243 [Whalleya microplaca]